MTLITDDEKCFIRVFIKYDLFPLYDTRTHTSRICTHFSAAFLLARKFQFRVLVHNGWLVF